MLRHLHRVVWGAFILGRGGEGELLGVRVDQRLVEWVRGVLPGIDEAEGGGNAGRSAGRTPWHTLAPTRPDAQGVLTSRLLRGCAFAYEDCGKWNVQS